MGRLAVVSALALGLGLLIGPAPAHAQIALADINTRIDALGPQIIAWRRDIHAHPELGNRETRTAQIVARHLRSLGMEVRTGVAHTGVIGVLRGGRPGPVVALRSDMDALPVQEATGLPFASTAQTQYNGASTYVAHACGHDLHIAMLMGAASVLAEMREQLSGTIVFVFQPAEEGPPTGEEGGAKLMMQEGALNEFAPSAIFGLHVVPGAPGEIGYRPEGLMAAADEIRINLHGRQTHGAWPWLGVDTISLSSAIVSELNTLAARTVDVTRTPTVLTISAINGGVRWNIIPADVSMIGTLRTFDPEQRLDMQRRIEQRVRALVESYGATAEIEFVPHGIVTYNDPALTAWAAPAMLEAAGGAEHVNANKTPVMVSEDFSYFQESIPGLFVHIGASPEGVAVADTPPNHSPNFSPNESVLPVGVRAQVLFAVRYLESGGLPPR